MRYILIHIILFFSIVHGFAAQQYTLQINLLDVQSSKVKVKIKPPTIKESFATFIIPITVYGNQNDNSLNYLIEDFQAVDDKGNVLPYEFISNNGIVIEHAEHLHEISYWVKGDADKEGIFQSVVENIRAGESYVLNHHGFFGYLQGYIHYPYELIVKKPADFYGASALDFEKIDAETDRAQADSFFDLLEKPILYALPDTCSFKVDDTQFNIAVYAESGKIKALQLRYTLKAVVEAVGEFMGGFPVEEYDFVMYFAAKDSSQTVSAGQYGGLMCAASSFYVLPEIKDAPKFKKLVRKVAAHELLHLLTPFHLHSELTTYAGFTNQKMSKHLWLYEGVVEYFGLLLMVRQKFITEEEFWLTISHKITQSWQYPEVSLTKMSQNIFQKKYQKIYPNIYHKGMLTALVLDLAIREEASKGNIQTDIASLRGLVLSLAGKYHHDKPFKDDELLNEIYLLTSPTIQSFFEKFVVNKKPLEYKARFQHVNITYHERLMLRRGTFGRFWLYPDYKNGTWKFHNVGNNELGLKPGDELVAINGDFVTFDLIQQRKKLIFNPPLGKPLKLMISRNGKTMTVQGLPKSYVVPKKDYLELWKDVGSYRKEWLYGE